MQFYGDPSCHPRALQLAFSCQYRCAVMSKSIKGRHVLLYVELVINACQRIELNANKLRQSMKHWQSFAKIRKVSQTIVKVPDVTGSPQPYCYIVTSTLTGTGGVQLRKKSLLVRVPTPKAQPQFWPILYPPPTHPPHTSAATPCPPYPLLQSTTL